MPPPSAVIHLSSTSSTTQRSLWDGPSREPNDGHCQAGHGHWAIGCSADDQLRTLRLSGSLAPREADDCIHDRSTPGTSPTRPSGSWRVAMRPPRTDEERPTRRLRIGASVRRELRQDTGRRMGFT